MSLSHAARVGPSAISTSTLAVVGLGGFVLANPEKALHLIQKALLAISDGTDGNGYNGGSSNMRSQQPIVIHTGGPSVVGGGGGGGGLGKGMYVMVLQVSMAAGLIWGSYALLVNVLPEQAKNMLPVTQGTFKQAVVSLGKGLLHVKDTLSAEISNLLAQQSELAHKQDETHEQVLYVQDQVADVHDDIGHMQTSIDDCKAALSSTDKRTTYIAKGIRLVTQGMTAMLPPDDELAKELRSFHKTDDTAHLVTAPRHRSEDKASATSAVPSPQERRRVPASDGSRASRGSRRSTRSSSERRRRRQDATDPTAVPRNKPTASYDDDMMDVHGLSDTLSVSTGTPIRHVMIPRKSKATHNKTASDEASITSTPPELKELEDIRALLLSMDKNRSAF